MGSRSPRTDGKSNIRRGGRHPADDTVNRLDEGMNPSKPPVDESAQEAPKKDKPKRGKIAELTKQLEEAAKRAEEAENRAKEADKKTEEANKKIKELETLRDEYSKSFSKRNQELAAAEKRNIQLEVDRNVTADNLRTSQNRIKELEDSNNVYIKGAKSLVNRQKALREENDNLQKQYNDITEGVRKSTLKSPEEVDQARKELESLEPKAEEVKTDNSGTTEETVTPETGEAKVEGEPKANTEQTQTTQEPKSEAKQTSTESSEMTPEEVYDYLSDKKNFKDAERYFASGKDAYVGTNDKHIPKSWFDVYKGNKDSDHSMFRSPNNKDVFTASLRDKGLLEDPKKEPSRAETEITQAETEAKRKFDEWIDSKGNKFRGIFGKHKLLYSALLGIGLSPAIMKGIDAIGDWYVNKAIEDNHIPDEEFFGGNSEDNEDYNGEPIEPGNVAEKVANAAQEAEQADNNAEEQAAQALQENLPQGETDTTNQSKGENPVATNASTPASTKASTAKPAPTQDTTQGLPPVVVNNTPPANAGSKGMTYSQRVEAGQTPQEGANNPDLVTAGLLDAMNQNPQAGSDAIGYGDLYDQNFIDYWAKRNPNLAFGVSQGRR